MGRTSFHIQHNTGLQAVLVALACGSECTPLDVYDFSDRINFSESVASKLVLPFLRQLGILDKDGTLGSFGVRLARLNNERPELVGEAVHARLYTLYRHAPDRLFSLAYAVLCDWLTARGEFTLDGDGQAELVGVVVQELAKRLGLDHAAIAFSKSSVLGAMRWLEATDPPALQDGVFRRRHVAPTLAVLWSVDDAYSARNVRYGTRLSLDEEREREFSQMLLLDPEDLGSVLNVTSRTVGPGPLGESPWLSLGAEGGFGRWLLLSSACPPGASVPGEPLSREFDQATFGEAEQLAKPAGSPQVMSPGINA